MLAELRRDIAAAPGKAAALVLSRLPLLLLLAVQLHLLGKVILWSLDNLAGFDTTMLDVQMAFLENPLYTTALFLLTWLLLTPFFEAGNFLLHTDIRTRQEGLDLQYRVQRLRRSGQSIEPPRRQGRQEKTREKSKIRKQSLFSLHFSWRPWRLGGSFFFRKGGQARAQQQTIRVVLQEIETIRAEIQKTEPYPGGQRWLGRLRGLQAKLARAGGGDARRYRWFDQALADFGDRKKEDALRILIDLHRRLSLLEDALREPTEEEARRSSEDIKSLLRGSEGRKVERKSSRQASRRTGAKSAARRSDARKHAGRNRRPLLTEAAVGGRPFPCQPRAAAVCPLWAGCCWAGWRWPLSSWAFSFT